MQREDAATPMDASPPAMAPSPSLPASAAARQEPVVRPNTQARSGSPGRAGALGGSVAANGGASYICRVDHCHADLTSAQAYFRRHRVCETHCKTAAVLVAGRVQRFCQQCSRFQSVAEFDGDRTSCSRRLPRYHQRRRRRI